MFYRTFLPFAVLFSLTERTKINAEVRGARIRSRTFGVHRHLTTVEKATAVV